MGAKRGELVAELGSHVADEYFAGVNPAAKADVNLIRRVERPPIHPFLDDLLKRDLRIDSRRHCRQRVRFPLISLRLQDPEKGHHAITNELVQKPAMLKDRSGRGFAVLLQK